MASVAGSYQTGLFGSISNALNKRGANRLWRFCLRRLRTYYRHRRFKKRLCLRAA